MACLFRSALPHVLDLRLCNSRHFQHHTTFAQSTHSFARNVRLDRSSDAPGGDWCVRKLHFTYVYCIVTAAASCLRGDCMSLTDQVRVVHATAFW